ncbi:MAG: hypothetical protein Q8N84_03695 [bacterium]|nr:hypothetical protein [bacterium]
MVKLTKILLIVIPVVFFLNFLTLANTNVTHSPSLQKIGNWVGLISLFSFALLVIYFIVRGIVRLFHPKNEKPEQVENNEPVKTKKENNRPLNLIWLVLFGLFVAPNIYCSNVINSYYGIIPYVFAALGLFVSLLLIIPRRNNFFILPLLLIIATVTNLAVARFYNLTWYFYPNFHVLAAKGELTEKWLAAGSWGVPFLTVTACVYVFLSSLAKLFFKKTWAHICFLIALFLTGLTSYLLFYLLPISLTFPKTEIVEKLEPAVTVELLDAPDPVTAKRITSVQSATSFFIYATNLQKGKRYGVRILTPEQKMRQEDSVFLYCRGSNCELNFGGSNHISDRFKPGIYTIQIIALEGKEMTIAAMAELEVTALVIKPFAKAADYPCEMWLTLGSSSEKLLRIDADSQDMTDIRVWVQCQKDKTYTAQVAVGTINNETQYYQSTIEPTDEPVRVVSLGGNTSHGLVRLIIDNQIMGEAIINRGFPICDGEKAMEGGNDSNCQ